jgi:uncharacterized protein (UPF0333 family)
MGNTARSGQAAVEYILAVAALLAVVGVMGYLVSAAHKSAHRTEALVGADCP